MCMRLGTDPKVLGFFFFFFASFYGKRKAGGETERSNGVRRRCCNFFFYYHFFFFVLLGEEACNLCVRCLEVLCIPLCWLRCSRADPESDSMGSRSAIGGGNKSLLSCGIISCLFFRGQLQIDVKKSKPSPPSDRLPFPDAVQQ